jgi:hypothetical protein
MRRMSYAGRQSDGTATTNSIDRHPVLELPLLYARIYFAGISRIVQWARGAGDGGRTGLQGAALLPQYDRAASIEADEVAMLLCLPSPSEHHAEGQQHSLTKTCGPPVSTERGYLITSAG